jgi:hypothetical protein
MIVLFLQFCKNLNVEVEFLKSKTSSQVLRWMEASESQSRGYLILKEKL